MISELLEELAERGTPRGADRVFNAAQQTPDLPVAGEPASGPQPRRHLPPIAIAAVLVTLGGVAALLLVRQDDSTPVDTDASTNPPATAPAPSTDPSELDAAGSGFPRLLPAADEWEVVSTDFHDSAGDATRSGVWAFDLDGALFILISQPTSGPQIALADAEIAIGYNRSLMSWTDGTDRLGLEGFNVDNDALRTAAVSLTRAANGWELPGAVVLAAEPAGPQPEAQTVRVELASKAGDGTIDLSSTVAQYTTAGSEGDFYRHLSNASSLGTTTQIEIDEHRGYIMTGGELPYALVYHDGYVTHWQPDNPTTELASLVQSVRSVSETDWLQATGRGAEDPAPEQSSPAELSAPTGLDQLGPDQWLYPARLPAGFEFEWAFRRQRLRSLRLKTPDGHVAAITIFTRGETQPASDDHWNTAEGSRFVLSYSGGSIDVVGNGIDQDLMVELVSSLGIVDDQSLPRPPIDYQTGQFTESARATYNGQEIVLEIASEGGYYATRTSVGDGTESSWACCSTLPVGTFIQFSGLTGPTRAQGEAPSTEGLIEAMLHESVAAVEIRLTDGSVINTQPQDTHDSFPVNFLLATVPVVRNNLFDEIEAVVAFDAAGNELGRIPFNSADDSN